MLKFFDFCAGIGGGRLGLENAGFKCVGHSEIDKNPAATYDIFFEKSFNWGDLMKINPIELPEFDIMISGFPCQTFSIVGKRDGFNDNRGLVIYGLAKIIKEKKLKGFILENVKGLISHNGGETLKIIINLLEELGYDITYKVLNSLEYGVPQMRERIYIVGIKKEFKCKEFQWPNRNEVVDIKRFLIDNSNKILPVENLTFQRYLNNKYNNGKINIEKILEKDYLVLDTRQSDLRIYEKKCPTLRTGRHGILYVKDGQLKKLSGYEALLLQGFPKVIADCAKENKIPESKLLSQAGNAMTVNVIQCIGEELKKCIKN